jgi:(4-O-methyl)-D-glucuronate---lignin esterase
VFERSADRAPAVLVSATPISGWTHLAVVYRDGQPKLYLNGKFAREGLKSGKIVHCGLGLLPPARRLVYYFEGDMTRPEFFAEPLGEDRIASLATNELPAPESPFPIEVSRRGNGILEALIWDPGHYGVDDGRSIEARDVPAPVTLQGPWQVNFPPDRGAPTNVMLTELTSLRLHPDPGVRYFSGTATYTRDFTVTAGALAKDRRLFLDLGRVEVTAAVKVNSRDLGILWKPPFRLDITEAAHVGTNQLEVQVTDLWPNRLIGDEQLPSENNYDARTHAIERLPDWYLKGEPKPAGGRTTFTTWQFYNKDDPLLEAGLLGPVRLFNPVHRTFSR